MDCLQEEFSSFNNDEEFIHGTVEVVDQTEIVEYIVEEEQIVEQQEEQPYVFDSDEYTQTGRKKLWTKPAIKLMLCLVEDLLPDVGTTSKLPTKAEMYKCVAREMSKEGYSFTGPQVENKFRGLEKTRKRRQQLGIDTIKEETSSKRKRKSEESLKEEAKSNEETVWIPCDDAGASSQDQVEFKIEPNTSSRANFETQEEQYEPAAEENPKPKNRKNPDSSRQLIRMFGKMAADRKRYHTKILEFLKEKDARGRRREERDQKKLELLERILSQRT